MSMAQNTQNERLLKGRARYFDTLYCCNASRDDTQKTNDRANAAQGIPCDCCGAARKFFIHHPAEWQAMRLESGF